MSEKTREIIQKFISHIETMQFAEAFSLLNDDGKYIVIGKTPVSGTYHGRKDLFERLLPALGSFTTPPKVKFADVAVDGNQGMLRASGAGVGPTGAYDQPYYVWAVRVEGEGFSEMIEFMDTVQLETALFGKVLADA